MFSVAACLGLLIFCQNFRISGFLIISGSEFMGCLCLEKVQWSKSLLFLGKNKFEELLCCVSAICFSEFTTSFIISVNSKATP